MGVRVMGEVFEHSRAQYGARLVLLAIADNASQLDGVGWPGQEELQRKTHLGDTAVRDAIRELERLEELETRRGQVGRVRRNVYRVMVGKYRAAEVVYENIPFSIREPFSRPPVSDGRPGQESGGSQGAGLVKRLWSRPPESGARQRVARPPESALTTGEKRRSPIQRNEPSVEPSATAA